jgi:hypothetical protein
METHDFFVNGILAQSFCSKFEVNRIFLENELFSCILLVLGSEAEDIG